MTTIDYALAYRAAGYSIIPIKSDGSKAPDLPSWAIYQERHATEKECREWWHPKSKAGIGIVCGVVSMNLEVMDFDDAETFLRFVVKVGKERIASLPQVRTPKGGTHLYLHRDFPPVGNRKLAQRRIADGTLKTLIETRGEGGQVLAPGTPVVCHASNLPYLWIRTPKGIP